MQLNYLRQTYLCINCVLLASCAHWPEAGHGGMAENDLGSFLTVESQYPLKASHGLRFDFGQLKNHLDILVLQGATACFPAAVQQAQLRETRIARELSGRFFNDAQNDILIQRQHLVDLEMQLNQVLREATCVPPQITAVPTPSVHSQIGNDNNTDNDDDSDNDRTTIKKLVNSDNQFATNSAVINPKYAIRLQEAAALLRRMPHRLVITGHADQRGNSEDNTALSLNRAKTVARFLVTQGMDASKISVALNADNSPLYEGNSSDVWLVNRAVTIELITIKVLQ